MASTALPKSGTATTRKGGRAAVLPQRSGVRDPLPPSTTESATSRVEELERLCSRLVLRLRKVQQQQQQAATTTAATGSRSAIITYPPPRCVFSDLDGTLLHAGTTLLEDGYSIHPYEHTHQEEGGDSMDPVEALQSRWPWPVLHQPTTTTTPQMKLALLKVKDPSKGADEPPLESLCLELPSLTAGPGYISLRTLDLVQAIRAQGCDFVIITGARSSTYLRRRHCPGLPVVDYEVVEGGGRMMRDPLAQSGPPREDDMGLGLDMPAWDKGWADEIDKSLSALRSVKEELLRAGGWVLDDRDYLTSFRVDVEASAPHCKKQWPILAQQLGERGLSSSFNLGKADIYPCTSGKAPAVRRLMARLMLLQPTTHDDHDTSGGNRDELCVALFDDDNDLGMAALCGRRIAVSITHPSVKKLVEEDKSVEQVRLPGVLGTEEALERVLTSLLPPTTTSFSS